MMVMHAATAVLVRVTVDEAAEDDEADMLNFVYSSDRNYVSCWVRRRCWVGRHGTYFFTVTYHLAAC